MVDEPEESPETPEEQAARLAWYQVITIQESVTPPEVFRPAQQYCWDNKPLPLPRDELIAVINSFANDKSLRSWVQGEATPVQVFTLWEAIAALSRRFFLLEDDEKPDPSLVAEVRLRPSAKNIFILALRLPPRE